MLGDPGARARLRVALSRGPLWSGWGTGGGARGGAGAGRGGEGAEPAAGEAGGGDPLAGVARGARALLASSFDDLAPRSLPGVLAGRPGHMGEGRASLEGGTEEGGRWSDD